MRQPTTKLPVGCKIYLQSTLGIFYGPAGLTRILDLLSISPTTPVGTSSARNSSSILRLWLYQQKLFQLRRIGPSGLLSKLTQLYKKPTRLLQINIRTSNRNWLYRWP